MNTQLKVLHDELSQASGETALCLATTANRNNPPVYYGTTRMASGLTAANIILADDSIIDTVIPLFDGTVDWFFLDCEHKNAVSNLVQRAAALIQKSQYLVFKPNDFTIQALDMWISLLCTDITGLNALIAGAGNIGSKIALLLAERGANVTLWGRNKDKTHIISDGLSLIKRGAGTINDCQNLLSAASRSNIMLGCTPGIPILNSDVMHAAPKDCLVIDVGNGTLTQKGIAIATTKGLSVYCLSPSAGFAALVSCWRHAKKQIETMGSKTINNKTRLVTPGILGNFGDVLVNKLTPPYRILGVCNGHGDLLDQAQSSTFITGLNLNDSE